MTELQILSAIKNEGGSMLYTDLLNLGKTDSAWDSIADRDLVRKLMRQKILAGDDRAHGSISFGVEGHLRLRQLQQEADQQAKQERQQRFDNKIAIANIFVPLVTFVVGVLVEHYAGILEWVLSFF